MITVFCFSSSIITSNQKQSKKLSMIKKYEFEKKVN